MNEIRFNQSPKQEQMRKEIIKETPVENSGNRNKSSWFKKVLKAFGIVAILAAVVLVVFFGRDIFSKIFKNNNQPYSAVFLTNGQVYFGKMTENNQSEITLNNVYYIQVDQNATKEEITNTLNQARFNLVKLGNELHGPTDELFINRSQVVFYEYLRDDSKVVESIINSQKK